MTTQRGIVHVRELVYLPLVRRLEIGASDAREGVDDLLSELLLDKLTATVTNPAVLGIRCGSSYTEDTEHFGLFWSIGRDRAKERERPEGAHGGGRTLERSATTWNSLFRERAREPTGATLVSPAAGAPVALGFPACRRRCRWLWP